jgi:hypothetical protein
MLIGHNPGLQQLDLARSAAGVRELRALYPTAALVTLAFTARSWRLIEPGTGKADRLRSAARARVIGMCFAHEGSHRAPARHVPGARPRPDAAVLLPDARTEEVIARLGRLVARLAQHGVEVDGPSMTLSYLAVRVIPG